MATIAHKDIGLSLLGRQLSTAGGAYTQIPRARKEGPRDRSSGALRPLSVEFLYSGAQRRGALSRRKRKA